MSDASLTESTKLRLVLDYLPCEPCLAVGVPDQELYCSVCRRLNRTVAQKTIIPVDVLVETPAPPEPEPIIVPPPPVAGPVPIPIQIVDEPPVPAPEATPEPAAEALPEPLVETPPDLPVEATLETIEGPAPPAPEEPAPAPDMVPLEAEAAPLAAEPAAPDLLVEAQPEPDAFTYATEDVAAPTAEELSSYTADEAPSDEDEEDDLFGVAGVSAVDEDDLFDYNTAPAKPRAAAGGTVGDVRFDLTLTEEQERLLSPVEQGPAPALDEAEFVIDPGSLENRAPEPAEDEFILEGFDDPAPEATAAADEAWAAPAPVEELPEFTDVPDLAPAAAEDAPWPEEAPAAATGELEGFLEPQEAAPAEAWAEPAVEELWSEAPQEDVWQESATAAPAPAETTWESATEEPWPEETALVDDAATEVVDFEVIEDDADVENLPVAEAWSEPAEAWPEAPVEAGPTPADEAWDEPVETLEIIEEDEPAAPEAVPAPEPAPAPIAAPAPAQPAEDAALVAERAATNVKLLDGVGPASRRRLRDLGIQTLGDLLERSPREITEKTGIPARDSERWHHVATLTVHAGIPLEYSEVLVSGGVAGIEGLRALTEDEIATRLAASSERPVTRGMIASWKRRV